MFLTFAPNEITYPPCPTPKAKWWSVVELPVEIPWFYVVLIRPNDEDLCILVSDPRHFRKVMKAKDAVRKITMALPPAMNGTAEWRFETVINAWSGKYVHSRVPVWVFETAEKGRHLLASSYPPGDDVEYERTMYVANGADSTKGPTQ